MIKLMTYKDVRFAVVIFVSTMNSSGLATKGSKNMHTVAAIFYQLLFYIVHSIDVIWYVSGKDQLYYLHLTHVQ